MNKTNIVTLRVPRELKQRLEREAKLQGVSINQLSAYLLNEQLTKIEALSDLENRLANKSIPELKSRVDNILNKIPGRKVENWDTVN
ncbi:MAG: toxin-antitoxin system HicB family antitoxin [candidate division KSB1 bacterium]|nr:toxin-antitoxin system HicB family antitoxin [candidate division KSB1 bacterium]